MKDNMAGVMRGRNMRVLGSSRAASMDSVPKFPPLKHRGQLDANYQGISGNAMTVPPPRESPERQDSHRSSIDTGREREGVLNLRNSSPHRSIPSSKSDSSNNNNKHLLALEKAKQDLKECMVREKQAKEKQMSLQKVIDELRAQLRDRDKTIAELQQQFQRQESQYEGKIKEEKTLHQQTKDELEKLKASMGDKDQSLEALRAEYNKKIADLNKMWEQKLKDLTEAKDKEISVRDEKLGRLKKQMADALKGNSWERQQQLDELTKELTRVQEEADMLRFKLKSHGKQKSGECGNCDSTSLQLQQSQKMIKERDTVIKELKTLCAKFEKQLTSQGLVIRQQQEPKKL